MNETLQSLIGGAVGIYVGCIIIWAVNALLSRNLIHTPAWRAYCNRQLRLSLVWPYAAWLMYRDVP